MHLVLAVEDVDRAYDFYRSAFGWEQHLEFPGAYVELELPKGDWLGLYRREGFEESAGGRLAPPANGNVTGTELYVMVDDLTEAAKRVREAGGRPLSRRAPREWGHEAAYFADPDGNVVAVARALD